MEKLQGRKAYIVSGVMAVATFAKSMGWVDSEAFLAMMGFLNALGLGALRAGVAKGSKK